jgi:hypothetical protein
VRWTSELFKDFGDQVLMVVLALVVCALLFSLFWVADEFHVNEIWAFVAWNSVALAPLVIKKYREQLKKPGFVLFSIAWMVIHGLFIVALMRWAPITLWLIFIPLELMAGGITANRLFGAMPSNDDVDAWRLTKSKDARKTEAGDNRQSP